MEDAISENLMKLIVAAIVIVAAFGILAGGIKVLFFDGAADQATRENFDDVVAVTNFLSDSNIAVGTMCSLVNYGEAGFALVGFSGSSSAAPRTATVRDEFCTFSNLVNRNPTLCGTDRACLCICKDGFGGLDDNDCNEDTAFCAKVGTGQTQLVTHDPETHLPIDLVVYNEGCYLGTNKEVKGLVLVKEDVDTIAVSTFGARGQQTVDLQQNGCIPSCNELLQGQWTKPATCP